MNLKSYLFYGYTKKSVDRLIASLTKRIRGLEDSVVEKDLQIADLSEQLRRVKSEEELIQEAIIDAKNLSRKIIAEAQQKADKLMIYVEDSVNDRLNQVESNLVSLRQTKHDLVTQEEVVRQQLRQTLDLYLKMIDHNSERLAEQNHVLDIELSEVAQTVQSAKNVLDFNKLKAEAISKESKENDIFNSLKHKVQL